MSCLPLSVLARPRALISAFLAGFFLASPLSAQTTLTLDDATRYQEIEGWGTCMIFWSLSSTPYWDPAWRAAYRDLGCNILRMDMKKSALVDPSGNYATPVPLGTDLQSNIDKMDFNKSDINVYGEMAAWLAENALEPERVRITGSLWSPPHWMKGPTGTEQYHVTNTSVSKPTPWLSGGTSGDSIGGRLLQTESNLEQFGRYLAAWVEGFEQQYGVPIYMMSIQNEISFENPFDSCTYEKGPSGESGQFWQFADALAAVRDAWQTYGIETKIMGPHFAQVGPTASNPWGLWQQMSYIQAVKDHSDPTLIDFLDTYNSNGYMGTSEDAVRALAGYWSGADAVGGNWGWLSNPQNTVYGVGSDGKRTWFSETGDNGTTWPGAINVALKMQNALVHGNVSAYVYWQMSDTASGENESTLLGKSHVADPHQSWKYVSFKHFSRYVRPGARRIDARFDNGLSSAGGSSAYDTANAISASAFVHDQDRTLTIVFVNPTSSSDTVTIDLNAAPAVDSFRVFRTRSSERFAELASITPTDGSISVQVPAQSLVTLTGDLLPAFSSADSDGDGWIDGFENYFGTDPNTPNAAVPYSVAAEGSDWVIEYAEALNTQGATAALEWSTDMVSWSSENLTTPVEVTSDGTARILRVTKPRGDEERIFVRFVGP